LEVGLSGLTLWLGSETEKLHIFSISYHRS
jgi:hypothetical protein